MKNLIKHIKCGRHSGFSLCCIAWYVMIWNNKLTGNPCDRGVNVLYTTKQHTWKAKYLKLKNIDLFGYVPCPICLYRKKVKSVYSCPISCK